jgi:hypothetical protein
MIVVARARKLAALHIDARGPMRIGEQRAFHRRARRAEPRAIHRGVFERRCDDEERISLQAHARFLCSRFTCASNAVSAPGVTPSMREAWPSVTGFARAQLLAHFVRKPADAA